MRLAEWIAAFDSTPCQSNRRTIPERATGPLVHHSQRMAVRLPAPIRPSWPQIKTAYTWSTGLAAPVTGQLSRLRGSYLPRQSVALVDESVADGNGRSGLRARRAPEPSGSERQSRSPSRVREPSRGSGAAGGGRRALSRAGAGTASDRDRPQRRDDRGVLRLLGDDSLAGTPHVLAPLPGRAAGGRGNLGVLAGRGICGYYHFLLDILPRLAILETRGVPEPDRWYVPLQRPFQREVLELAGFSPGADVIESDLVTHVRAESLLVPGLPDAHLRTPAWAVAYVRERLRGNDLALVPGRRLYVTRGTERFNRTVTNEADLVRMLADLGFTVIDPAR